MPSRPSRSLCLLLLPLAAHAATLELQPLDVAAERPAFRREALPAVVESLGAEQIAETVNAATAAAALKHLPSLQVRERYIGDRNGIVAARTIGTVASAQSLVYADGILLSNLLGNSFAYPPRWGMVSPEEIARVDVLYGPYSALYPGNSMGGVVNFTTRMPERFESHANVQRFRQDFELYGTDESYDGMHASASIGSRAGDFSFWLGADHLDNEGQPMSFATATRPCTAGCGGAVAVTGAHRDTSEKGQPRLVFGGYGIDRAIQDNAKLKLAYALTPTLEATYTASLWQLESASEVDPYLRRVDGSAFYNGNASINGTVYRVSGLNPGRAEVRHLMQALSLGTDTGAAWDWQIRLSSYDYASDLNRTSVGSDPATVRVGIIQDMEGTGWAAAELRGTWRPAGHQVDFGYHASHYRLRSTTYVTADWRDGAKGAINSASRGETAMQALYAQDAWQLAPRWTLTAGARLESWHAWDGANRSGNVIARYDDERDIALSPKLALGFEMSPQWGLRAAFGKAYRYPTVSELYQSVTSGNNLVQSNPDLRPERILSAELSAERRYANGSLRATVFHEHKRDALAAQTVTNGTNACGVATCSYIQNIDSVRTYGVELAGQWQDAGLAGLDLGASLTWTKAEILEDSAHPEYDGNHSLRIPDLVAKATLTYRQGEALTYSLAARYSGRQYFYLDNSDSHPGTYNGASRYFFVDAKASYRFRDRWLATLGVDNLNDYKAYVLHPYPQRTLFAQLRFDY